MIEQKSPGACSLVAVLLLSAGALCAKDEAPVMYPFSEMRSLAVLPTVDSRIDKKNKVDFEKIRKQSIKWLSRRRYAPVASDRGNSSLVKLTEDDLKNLSPELMRGLGPEGGRWVLVLSLGDVASRTTLGTTANAQASAFLFDLKQGKLAWSDTITGKSQLGGWVGSMMSGKNRKYAIQDALVQMLEVFPKLPKAGK